MLRVMFWSEVILTQLKCADEVNHNEGPYVDIIGGHLKVHENNSFKIRFLKSSCPLRTVSEISTHDRDAVTECVFIRKELRPWCVFW